MKKLFALLLAMMMIFSLAACGDNDTTDPDKDNPSVSQSGESNNTDPNAPVSSIGNAAGRGSYTKHNAEDAQKLLVSMGLPEYPGGEILYASEFDEGDGTVYINNTTLDECVDYCRSLSGVSPVFADSNTNGKYVNYACEGNGFAFTVKFFAEKQEKSYTSNGNPVTDVWQVEIDFTPNGGSSDVPSGPVIADGWEIPEYPYGELVYTRYNDKGEVVALYFNNTTIEECHEYCQTLVNAGYLEVMNPNIHDDDDGLGRYMLYGAMHPSSYRTYQVDYPSEKMEHTVDTPDGEVVYQLAITNTKK